MQNWPQANGAVETKPGERVDREGEVGTCKVVSRNTQSEVSVSTKVFKNSYYMLI